MHIFINSMSPSESIPFTYLYYLFPDLVCPLQALRPSQLFDCSFGSATYRLTCKLLSCRKTASSCLRSHTNYLVYADAVRTSQNAGDRQRPSFLSQAIFRHTDSRQSGICLKRCTISLFPPLQTKTKIGPRHHGSANGQGFRQRLLCCETSLHATTSHYSVHQGIS